MDTFENSFSELLEEEGEEKTLVASLTLWPTATSGPFKSRTRTEALKSSKNVKIFIFFSSCV